MYLNRLTALLTGVLLAAASASAQTATDTFVGGTSWNNASSWSLQSPPNSVDIVAFSSTSLNPIPNTTLDALFSIQALTFNTGANNFSIDADPFGSVASQSMTLNANGGNSSASRTDIDLSASTTGVITIGDANSGGVVNFQVNPNYNLTVKVENAAANLVFGTQSYMGSGGIMKTGAGSVTLNSNALTSLRVRQGTVILNNGMGGSNSTVFLSGSSTPAAIIMNGGQINGTTFDQGVSGLTSTFTQNAGDVTYSNELMMDVNALNLSNNNYVLNGGSILTPNFAIGVSSSINIGIQQHFVQTGGTINVPVNSQVGGTGVLAMGGAGEVCTYLMSGGQLNASLIEVEYAEYSGSNTFTQTGGVVQSQEFYCGSFGTGPSTLNLSGGAFEPGTFYATSSATVNFNGGIARATQSGQFFGSEAPCIAQAGGAIFDSNGFDINGGIQLNHDASLGATPDGGFTKQGLGTMQSLSANSNYTGRTLVSGGALQISAIANGGVASALGASTADPSNLVLNGGALSFTGDGANATDRGMTVGSNGGTIEVVNSAASLSFAGAINGGMLTKIGAGSLILTGTTDNNGLGVTVNAGSVILEKTSNTPSSVHAVGGGGLIVNSNATVQLAGVDQIYDGANVQVNGGTFDLNSQSETISALTGNGTVANTSSGAGALTVGSGSFSGTISGSSSNGISIAMNGAGNTFTLSGGTDNSYLGVTVNAGTVVLGKTSGAGVHAVGNGLTINTGGTAQLGGTGQAGGNGVDQIYDANTVTLNGGTFDMNGRSETIGALIGNAGSITTTASGVSNLTVSGGGTFGGSITDGAGQIALGKTGNNTLTLNGNADSFTGNTTISAGTLAITGSIGSNAVTLDGSGNFASLKLMNANALGSQGTIIQATIIVDTGYSPTIVMDFNGNETVSSLQIDGQFVMSGIYGTTNEPAADEELFASDAGYDGTLTVLAPEPSAGGILLLAMTSMLARRRRQATHSPAA